MIDYEVGEIPSVGLGVEVRDDRDNPINTIGYATVELQLRGTDDEAVDLRGVTVTPVTSALGTFVVQWPKTRSIFTKKGKYLMRLVLRKSDGSVEYTRPTEIRVREFGRLYN
jgi:hypothetical protein